ncbi:HAD family hydrolase [Nonlabens spongiae]|uniref:HAD family hydrolase n=1 Tax=Nonlabens spongiae TaxID=331648 RepID=UPI001FE71291|nr:HAD family phosphatase [Nonlabens spongiae]
MPIKNIIFDFGDVFVNLDKTYVSRQLDSYSVHESGRRALDRLNKLYEVGSNSTKEFLNSLHEAIPQLNSQQLKEIWNGMLLDFPTNRLDFLVTLSRKRTHKIFLLSNTNDLHIENIKENMGADFETFKNAFDGFYLSHEIGLRKPNTDIYEFVLNKNNIKAEDTLFIDDTVENTDAANK